MTGPEIRARQAALFGRVADELTRQDLGRRRYRVALRNGGQPAVQKEDGSFAFPDLAPSPPDYQLDFAGREFHARALAVTWPGLGPMVVAPAGEDELQVIVTRVTGARVSFATVRFLPTIPAGAVVIKQVGAPTTLVEDLEGSDVDGAELAATSSVAVGHALRVIRSGRLILRPGPYYPFPPGATLCAFRVVAATAGDPPLAAVQIQMTMVNGAAVTALTVGGVTLYRANLPGTPPPPSPPPIPFLLGTAEARTVSTNERGEAVFYYPSVTPVTALTVTVSKTAFVTQTLTVPVVPARRTVSLVRLVHS